MEISVWIILEDGADRPYVTTSPPSLERRAMLETRAAELGKRLEIIEARVPVPGWRVADGLVIGSTVGDAS